jgi:hypothetical protein
MNEEHYNLTEETYKILCEEGDLYDVFNEIEYDDYEFAGECDYD